MDHPLRVRKTVSWCLAIQSLYHVERPAGIGFQRVQRYCVTEEMALLLQIVELCLGVCTVYESPCMRRNAPFPIDRSAERGTLPSTWAKIGVLTIAYETPPAGL